MVALANAFVARGLRVDLIAAESGGDCWKSLLERGYLSRRDLTLIEAAKRSGNLPWALREIADVRGFGTVEDVANTRSVESVGGGEPGR